ncbi:MAG: sensor histidine kinase [Bacteroidetes bacterium]|nr:MAG: sensor histidine kinase [Bacteroidota bacterium]TAF92007.1 MAG: sensor histidine kinase [Bacteroidota bacterium]
MATSKSRYSLITISYWFLLTYIVAALVWWFISLETQNHQMFNMRLAELNKDDPAYLEKLATISNIRERKTAQYVGEGVTFFVLIVVGAWLVYRAARKQIKLQLQQQNFMMAVTHELKTPIAVTKLNLETLQKRNLPTESTQTLLQQSIHETDRLNSLCNNILLASQLDGDNPLKNFQQLSFTQLVVQCVQEVELRFPKYQFSIHTAADFQVQGEHLQLQMLVNNLLQNAIKYGEKNGSVHVTVEAAGGQKVQLLVADNGPGIPDSEKKKVFEKFYRIGNEGTRAAKGTGLGLYLCKKIVENHHGQLTVQNNQPQGCIFTATLPGYAV